MIYYLDANCFIQPYNNYCPFDLAPGYWRFIENCFRENNIRLFAEIRDEVICQQDVLANWLVMSSEGSVVATQEQTVFDNLRTISDWVNESDYKKSAKDKFQRAADQFIIAHVMSTRGTLVTCELPPNRKRENILKSQMFVTFLVCVGFLYLTF